jgi:hypothetical protein
MSSITFRSSLKKMINNYKLKPLSKEEALKDINGLKEDLGIKNFRLTKNRNNYRKSVIK